MVSPLVKMKKIKRLLLLQVVYLHTAKEIKTIIVLVILFAQAKMVKSAR
jgi:hypothetical protein